jgi:chromosome partitioning protein
LVALHQQYPDNAWSSVIPVDTKVRDASREGMPLPLFDKSAKAVEAYSELLELLLLDKAGDKPLANRT